MCDGPLSAASLESFQFPPAPAAERGAAADTTADAPCTAAPHTSQPSTVSLTSIRGTQSVLHSFARDDDESAVYPPVPVLRQRTQGSTPASSFGNAAPSQRSQSDNIFQRLAAGKTVRSVAGAEQTPWETLQADTAASAAYAAKVRHAKQLLHDFQRYQQQQQQSCGSDSTSRGDNNVRPHTGGDNNQGIAVLQPEISSILVHSPTTGGSHAKFKVSISSIPGKTSGAALRSPAEVNVLRSLGNNNNNSNINSTQLSRKDHGCATNSLLNQNASTTAQLPPRPLTAFHSNTTGAGSDVTNSAENSSFSPAAFEVAKHRARQLLFYNAKAQAGFSEQGLALTRAVYKELLRRPPTTRPGPPQRCSDGVDVPVVPSGPTTITGEVAALHAQTVQDTRDIEAEGHKAQKPSDARSTLPALASTAAEAEAKRALDLLCGIRAMRRQTEELTVALLHACGEWECWRDTEPSALSRTSDRPPSASSKKRSKKPQSTSARQHLFADLFLCGTASVANAKAAKNTERELRKSSTSAGAELEVELQNRRARSCAVLREALHLPSSLEDVEEVEKAGCDLAMRSATTFLQLAETPAPRALPPPPPTSTQLELFAMQQGALRHAHLRWQSLLSQRATLAQVDDASSESGRGSLAEEETSSKASHRWQAEKARHHRGNRVDAMETGHAMEDDGAVYRQFQHQLLSLRAQRRGVQQTYDALHSATAAAARPEFKVKDADSVSVPVLEAGDSPLTPGPRPHSKVLDIPQNARKSNTADKQDSSVSATPRTPPPPPPQLLPAALACDTLLSSPSVLAAEKTRPWMDSVDVEGRRDETPLSPSERTTSRKEEPALDSRVVRVVEGSTDIAKSKDGAFDATTSRNGETKEDGASKSEAAPLTAKANAFAAAAARLRASSLFASVGSDNEDEDRESEPKAVKRTIEGTRADERNAPPIDGDVLEDVELDTRRTDTGRKLSDAPAGVPSSAFSTSQSAKEARKEQKGTATTNADDSAAASQTAESVYRTASKKVPMSVTLTEESYTAASPTGVVNSSNRATQQVDVASSTNNQHQNVKRGVACGGDPFPSATAIKPFAALGGDNDDDSDSTSGKSSDSASSPSKGSETTSNTSYSSYTTSSTFSNGTDVRDKKCVKSEVQRAAGLGALPHACVASWHPYLNAALTTHPDALDAVEEAAAIKLKDELQQQNERTRGDRTHRERTAKKQVKSPERCVDGMDAKVFEELSRWVAAQEAKKTTKRKKKKGQEGCEEDAGVCGSPLSADDLKVLSAWLHDAANNERGATICSQQGLPSGHEKKLSAGGELLLSSCRPPPLPPAVQRALQIIMPEYTPPSLLPDASPVPPSNDALEAKAADVVNAATAASASSTTTTASEEVTYAPLVDAEKEKKANPGSKEEARSDDAFTDAEAPKEPANTGLEKENRKLSNQLKMPSTPHEGQGEAAPTSDDATSHSITSAASSLSVAGPDELPPVHPHLQANDAHTAPGLPLPVRINENNSQTSREKLVKSSQKRSFFQRIFVCGGR